MTKRQKRLFCLVLFGAFTCSVSQAGAAAADEPLEEFNLDQIVVTANRLPQTNFDAHANVNVVTRKDIEENHYQTVSDALRQVPGVTIQNYSATGANYSADGLYINGTSHVIVLIDGQRANTNGSVFSVFQPSEISNMDAIERIEVLKGSASTLYGSDAVGGVINIITRKPKNGEVSTKVSAAFGSYDKRTFNLYHQGSTKDGFYYAVGLQKDTMGDYKDGQGNTTINDIDGQTYNAKIGKRFGDRAEVNLSYSRYKLNYERPEVAGWPSAYTGNRVEGKKDNEKWALTFDYKFDDAFRNTLSLFTRTSDLDDNTNHPANLWLMREETWGISDQLTYTAGQHTLVAGIDYYKDKMKKYQDAYTPSMTGEVSNKAFFMQDTMKFGALTVTPGVRFSHHSIYGSNTSLSGVVAYDINDRANVYVSYKEFFRAPYLYELYNPSFGSEKLEPEKGHTVELGGNVRLDDKTTVSAHVFRTMSDNLIGSNPITWKYYNAGDERITGFDLQVARQLAKEWNVTAAYTYLHIPARNSSQNSNRDGYIPRGVLDLGIHYDAAKFNANLSVKGVLGRPGRLVNEPFVADSYKSYWLCNLGVNYRPVEGMNVFLRLNNLFNRMYTEQCYDMRTPGGNGWYSQPGRNFLMGVEYTF